MISSSKMLAFFCLVLTPALSTPFVLNNQSSTSFEMRYIIGNGDITPQPSQLNHQILSLELLPNNMPLRAVIRLHPYDLNIALFNGGIQITNCEFGPIICQIDHHQIIFKDRNRSLNHY